jgi:LmbE family N-acetylglucosaminyl deacetylase
MKQKNIILFTAHPDDHLTCAGTLMLLKEKGFKIHEVVATKGEQGPWREKETSFKKKELQEKRSEEISKASEIIGIESTSYLGLPDSRVEKSHKAVDEIIGIIREKRPDFVFTINSKDYHTDHTEVSKMVTVGVERASWDFMKEKGEPFKVPIFLLSEGFYFGRADVVVDITDYVERKKKVIDVYDSQINSAEKVLLQSMNSYRGFFCREDDLRQAEAFEVPEKYPINFNKLVDLF